MTENGILKPPGAYLLEWRSEHAKEMSNDILARALDIERETLVRFFFGEARATEHLVARLWALTGISIETWWSYEDAWRRSGGFSRN